MPQLRLTTTFRAKEIENREPMLSRSIGHHITEQRGEIEREAYPPIFAKHLEELVCKLFQSNGRVIQMHKLLFKREKPGIILVYLRRRRQVEIAHSSAV